MGSRWVCVRIVYVLIWGDCAPLFRVIFSHGGEGRELLGASPGGVNYIGAVPFCSPLFRFCFPICRSVLRLVLRAALRSVHPVSSRAVSCLASRLGVSSHSIVPSCVSCLACRSCVSCCAVSCFLYALRLVPCVVSRSCVPCRASRVEHLVSCHIALPRFAVRFCPACRSCVLFLSDCPVVDVACGTVSPCSPLTIQMPFHALRFCPCRSPQSPYPATRRRNKKPRRGRDAWDETASEDKRTSRRDGMKKTRRGNETRERNGGTRRDEKREEGGTMEREEQRHEKKQDEGTRQISRRRDKKNETPRRDDRHETRDETEGTG